MKLKALIVFFLMGSMSLTAQKSYQLQSPDKKLQAVVTVGDDIRFSFTHDGTEVLAASPISMTLQNGVVLGASPKVSKVLKAAVDKVIPSPFYKKTEVQDIYNEMTLSFRGNYGLVFRMYNDGLAYRFTTKMKNDIVVVDEEADYTFSSDHMAFAPYVNSKKATFEEQFMNSFEQPYVHEPITKLNSKRLMILPLLVELDGGKKLCITEADLEDYPGMFLNNSTDKPVLKPIFASYPKVKKQGGHNNLQMLVEEREDYIAKTSGTRAFPWRVNMAADLMQVIPEIDIPELVNYGKSKNVGIILWAGYHAFDRDMEKVVKHYSNMGVKGFKVDFMDRDDQEIVDFLYRGAETCAKYKMMVDYHGICKPTGLQRTYPNVINYEGVHGLENMKWVASTYDMPLYDVTIPFVRMVAGPMDYTQGAMRNAIRKNYAPIYTEPMSQGTRCHQLATYVIFESPLNMLCDNPSNYNREPECTEFIANIPTVWEKTVALDGKVGEFVADWYVGALTNWDAREVELDLSFLGDGNYKLELFKDGINADRAACDYKKEVIPVPADRKVKVKMAPGGGWAAKIYK